MMNKIVKTMNILIYAGIIFILLSSCGKTHDYKIVEKIFLENELYFSKKKFKNVAFVKKNRVVLLYLSKRNITIIPDDISELSELKEISLSNNKIKVLPESFSLLSKLEFLSITSNQLTKLPDNFNQLKALKCLSISGNKINALPPEFGKLQSLRTLSFSHIKYFSNDFADLSKLRSISFGDDILTTTIPLEIFSISSLESLSVGGDKFKIIPSEIKKLKKLKYLRLHGVFTDIPESIGYLNQVKSMTLTGSYKALPASISGMKSLKCLILKSRELRTLPEQIYDLKYLEEINLDRNSIQYLPNGISRLKSLKEFYLGDNNLTGLPDDLFETTHWKREDGYVLSIGGNKICNVTEKQDEWLKTFISPRWRSSQRCK